MDFTTQAAIVAALLALLVLLGSLALRDRRRRSAEVEQESGAVTARADWIAQLADDPAPDEAAVVEEPAVEEPHDEPVFEEPVVDEPVVEEPVVDEPNDEPVLEELPVVDEEVAPRGWRARRRARRLAGEVEEPVGAADTDLVPAQSIDEQPIDEQPIDDEQTIDTPSLEEPAFEELPVLAEPVAARGWRARRRARRLAKEFEQLVLPTEAGEAMEQSADEQSIDEQPIDEPPIDEPMLEEQDVDLEAAVEDIALVQASLSDAADQLADEQADGTESAAQAELRVLRAQVRALEEAFQSQLAEVRTSLAVVETPVIEPRAYLRQISLAVRGIAEHTDEQENPHRTLARVAAAVERLGVPNSMDRPVLPLPSDPPPHPRVGGPWKPTHRREVPELQASTAAQGEVIAFPGATGTLVEELVSLQSHGEVQVSPQTAAVAPQPEPEPELEPMPELLAEPVAEPAAEPAPELMPEPTQVLDVPATDPILPTYGAVEVVLPVPPPAQSQPQTTRRRFRR